VVTAYYNEFDPFAADWLENLIKEGLIPNGVVDRRSIADVSGKDLEGFTHVHFFAGIGGWALALRLAGWPDDRPIGTGSCPCQPFSAAGKQKAQSDERHLWPIMFNLVKKSGIDVWAGEQVASAIRHGWLDGICADLEGSGYACGAVVLGAHSAGAPHLRQRLYWVANSTKSRHARTGQKSTVDGDGQNSMSQRGFSFNESSVNGAVHRMANTHINVVQRVPSTGEQSVDEQNGRACGVSNSEHSGRSGRNAKWAGAAAIVPSGAWDDHRIIHCTDKKSRRVGRSVQPLAYGIPASVGPVVTELQRMGHSPKDVKRLRRAASQLLVKARRNRVVRLKGYGNAIVDVVAAEFIKAFMELEMK